MGIRFLCRHCNSRLNVKASQAGQEGFCPHCQQTLTVPLESSIPGPDQLANRTNRSQPHLSAVGSDGSFESFVISAIDDQVTMDGIPAEQQLQHSVGSSSNQFSAPRSRPPSDQSSGELFMLSKPLPPESFGKIDPITDAPTRVWYFRSRTIGEKGPLKAKAMRKHLENGDVTIGCIVWREDWEDWVLAEQVFPDLAAEAKRRRREERVRQARRTIKDSTYQMPDELNPNSELNRRRRRKKQIFVAAIVLGLILVGVLTLTLMWIASPHA